MNKKRIIIGDPHGMYGILKKIVEKETPADIIVLGDYLDSYDIHPYDCLEGLKRTLELKETYDSGEFILLLGNHDAHYLPGFTRGSGWSGEISQAAEKVLKGAIDTGKIRFSYIDKPSKTIYTHAGVSMTWFEKWCQGNLENIETLEPKAFQFIGSDPYGDDPRNSPLWIRPNSLSIDPYYDTSGEVWNQVVGHTYSASPSTIDFGGSELYIIDCMQTYYLKEELDGTGKVINRKFIKVYEKPCM